MKKITTIISLFVVLTGHAQSRTGQYSKITADHWGKEDKASTIIHYKQGTLKVTQTLILIDSAGNKPQVYDIVKRGEIEAYVYGDYIQLATVVYPVKAGLKALEVVFYLDKSKRITDVIFKRTPHYNQTYTFK